MCLIILVYVVYDSGLSLPWFYLSHDSGFTCFIFQARYQGMRYEIQGLVYLAV